ncbi:hypothetical protein E2L06_04090 [Haloterrigena sp. H1]|uniref:phage NrS-1 polymerase family protein n=1 Tax=Haloterrigena sp. H1 TaxID=2552943 RepID=UPI00110E9818|nr:hypothetical protein [Haloterrigena sp. H1]TMT85814.1 hypothetical protein E2L06_04090 [Haloterrigena sp. H1]
MSADATSGDTQTDFIQTLKQRQNWICWKFEERDGDTTKTPIKPYSDWNDHQYASSTDPDTWRDYETARDYHKNSGNTDGIGFVFDADDVIVGIDLDDCHDPETGETAAWAQDIINDLNDIPWEYSPSGTGFHGYAIGFLPGDKTRSGIDGEEGHIEMYEEGRFFTVTFDHVDGTGMDVKPANDRIKQVYNEHIAEDDPEPTSESKTTETDAQPVDLEDDDIIEKAKNAKNGQDFDALWNGNFSGYESQSEADMALCNHLAFWTGKDASRMDDLFRRSGLIRDKWDEDRGDKTYGERTISNAIANCSEVYEPPEEPEEGHLYSPIREKDGGYGTWENDKNGDQYWNPITTFTVDVNAYLDDPDNDEMLIDATVVPASAAEQPYDVAFTPSVFNDVRKFKDTVCTGRTTTFDGKTQDLNALRLQILQTDAPERVGTRKIGIHDGELVTPNGVFGEDWELDNPTHRYIDSGAQVEEKWALRDDGEFDEEEVARICEWLPQVRDTERWYPVIGWYYSTLVTHWIREWTGQMPMLGVDGDTGAGKSGSLEILHKMMGLDGSPHSPKATKFAQIKLLSSTTNIPVWYDEYKPSELSQYKQDAFQDLLRRTTRGADESRGNADQTVTTYRMTAPILISGEQSIQGAAEERRTIRTQFRKTTTNNPACDRAFAEMVGDSYEDGSGVHYCEGLDLQNHAKAVHQYVMQMDEDEAKGVWNEAKSHIHNLLSDAGIGGVGDLEQQGLQMVKFGMVLFQHFGNTMGADLSHVTNEDIDAAILYIARSMGEDNRMSHVDEFMGLLGNAIQDGALVWGQDIAIVHEGDPNEELRIKMERAHHAVSKYVREHGLTGYDLLNTPKDYKSRMGDMADENNSYVIDVSKNTTGMNRCVAIDTYALEEQVDGFDRMILAH